MTTIKIYFVGSKLSKELLNRQIANIEHLEIVGESDCPVSAGEEIILLMPHVVIHATDKYEERDYLLLQRIKAKSPQSYYIVIGNTVGFSFRVRCLSAGADAVLSLEHEMTRVNGILRNMIFTNRPMSSPDHELLFMNDNLRTKSSLRRYFSFMDDYSECLMFADQDLVLRHFNCIALVKFSTIQEFLPDKLERLVGKPLDVFHRQQSISTKIISDPRNLPHRTQIIIGPKTFDLNVYSIYDENSENRAGILAHWAELPEMELKG